METYIILVLLQAVLLAVQGTMYLVIQRFQGPHHDMEQLIDRRIPLVSQTVFIYGLWYPLIAVYPLYLYSCSPAAYYQYILAIVLDIVISLFIYLFYPTSFQRPEPPADTFSGKILRLVYIVNYKGLNCMPSMHCSQCFIILLSVVSCAASGMMHFGIMVAICILACMILVSTLLTKQHVLIDMAAALPVGVGCFIVSQMIL